MHNCEVGIRLVCKLSLEHADKTFQNEDLRRLDGKSTFIWMYAIPFCCQSQASLGIFKYVRKDNKK